MHVCKIFYSMYFGINFMQSFQLIKMAIIACICISCCENIIILFSVAMLLLFWSHILELTSKYCKIHDIFGLHVLRFQYNISSAGVCLVLHILIWQCSDP